MTRAVGSRRVYSSRLPWNSPFFGFGLAAVESLFITLSPARATVVQALKKYTGFCFPIFKTKFKLTNQFLLHKV